MHGAPRGHPRGDAPERPRRLKPPRYEARPHVAVVTGTGLNGGLAYLHHHRGWTHALAFSPIVALAPLPIWVWLNRKDKPGALEGGDVLLHGGERHRVAPGEGRDRPRALHRHLEDVAPGGVGEGVEEAIDLVVAERIYNHKVVD